MSRLLLRARNLLTQPMASRTFASNHQYQQSPPFQSPPSPPRLPQKEQEEYERLQQTSRGAFSLPASGSAAPSQNTTYMQSTQAQAEKTQIEKGDEVHPDMRRGPKPEFEGDRNPRTGEIGGPKNEPLRWGSDGVKGDWSYGGRVSDF